MGNNFLSRQHLESLSTADLINLADDYGIDIPDNLNRRFIIGELLEFAEEYENEQNSDNSVIIANDEDSDFPSTLPKSYNDTKINAILRNPAWVYVYWDIKESDAKKLEDPFLSPTLSLRIFFYDSAYDEKPSDSFDIQIDATDRERTLLIPAGKKFFTVSLVLNPVSEAPHPLATTHRIEIPQESENIRNLQPGKDFEMSQLVRLSGMKQLLHDHYLNHRQSFSN